jgi:pyocin large subunit-like protein
MSGPLKLLFAALAAGLLIYADLGGYIGGSHKDKSRASTASTRSSRAAESTAPIDRSWGHPATLPDHFARHGADFGARSAQEYAAMASQFLQRGRTVGFAAKVDSRGDLRVFDSRSGAFGAYNANGTTKTFFKPHSPAYFKKQPGRAIDLRTWRPT